MDTLAVGDAKASKLETLLGSKYGKEGVKTENNLSMVQIVGTSKEDKC